MNCPTRGSPDGCGPSGLGAGPVDHLRHDQSEALPGTREAHRTRVGVQGPGNPRVACQSNGPAARRVAHSEIYEKAMVTTPPVSTAFWAGIPNQGLILLAFKSPAGLQHRAFDNKATARAAVERTLANTSLDIYDACASFESVVRRGCAMPTTPRSAARCGSTSTSRAIPPRATPSARTRSGRCRIWPRP